jgi:hypothetical protein
MTLAEAPFVAFPRLVAAPGGYVVTWLQHDREGDSIRARHLAPSGQPVGDDLVVDSGDGVLAALDYPSVATDGSGNLFFAWNRFDGSAWGLYARVLPVAAGLGPRFAVSGQRSPWCAAPVLAHPEGGFAVGWEDAIVIDLARPQELRWQRFAIDGAPLTTARVVNRLDGSGKATNACPDLALAPSGDMLLTWTRSYETTGGPYESAAFAALLAQDGSPRGGEFRLGRARETRQYSAIAAAVDPRRFVVLWGDGTPSTPAGIRLVGQTFAIQPAGADPCRFDGHGFACDVTHDGVSDLAVAFGAAGDVPLLGEVGGQGRHELCAYRRGVFLCDVDRDGRGDLELRFGGRPQDRPFLADLNGDGRQDACVARGGRFLCDTAHDGGTAEVVVGFGLRTDLPLMGDVDGDGDDDPCLWRGGRFLCDTAHDGRFAEVRLSFGAPGDSPLLADADRDGDADFCVYRGAAFLCDTAHDGGAAESVLPFDAAGGVPLLGNVDGI